METVTRSDVFIGMGEKGMAINPQSSFWKKNVSSSIRAVSEAVKLLADVCATRDWNFIFKPHPEQITAGAVRLDNEGALTVMNINTYHLVEKVDVVVSIGSALDYIVLMLGKPLVQFGKTGMNYVGCSYTVDNNSDLEKKLECALTNGFTVEQKTSFQEYILYLLDNYLWDDLTHPNFPYGKSIEEDIFENCNV